MMGGATGRPLAKSTGPGTPDRDAPDRCVGRAGEHVVDHRHGGLERLGGALGDVPRAVLVVEDVALEHRDADVDVECAERADDDAPAVAAEPQGPRGTAAGGGPELAVLEIAHLDRVVDPLGDDAATEPGDPADLRSRRCRRRHAPC